MAVQHMSFNNFVPSQLGPVVDWAGGDCPVHPDTVVKFYYRNGRSGIGRAIPDDLRVAPAVKYAHLIWQHAPMPGRTKPENDIVAYQVLNG